MKKYLITILFFQLFINGFSQDLNDLAKDIMQDNSPVIATFKTTRLVNAQTTEQVKAKELNFDISHRFDDFAGKAGGVATFYGIDYISDIRLSLDYGITNNWDVGIARSRGAYFESQIVDFSTKYKIISQQNGKGFPLTVSAYVVADMSTMKSSEDVYSVTYFKNNNAHRINYVGQIIIARKLSRFFSLELLPTYIHRNYVLYTDINDLMAIGIGGRLKITKHTGIIADFYHVFDANRIPKNGYYNPLGIGVEIETGGHVFHLMFSNNKGLIESQYLTENKSSWTKGEFRLGFNISRTFNTAKKIKS